MATVMLMEWPDVNQEQYNRVMSNLGLDKNPPAGAIFHVAGFTAGSLRVLDIWDSQQAFERFQKDRLTAAVQKAGITGQPKVQFFPVHNSTRRTLKRLEKPALRRCRSGSEESAELDEHDRRVKIQVPDRGR